MRKFLTSLWFNAAIHASGPYKLTLLTYLAYTDNNKWQSCGQNDFCQLYESQFCPWLCDEHFCGFLQLLDLWPVFIFIKVVFFLYCCCFRFNLWIFVLFISNLNWKWNLIQNKKVYVDPAIVKILWWQIAFFIEGSVNAKPYQI